MKEHVISSKVSISIQSNLQIILTEIKAIGITTGKTSGIYLYLRFLFLKGSKVTAGFVHVHILSIFQSVVPQDVFLHRGIIRTSW